MGEGEYQYTGSLLLYTRVIKVGISGRGYANLRTMKNFAQVLSIEQVLYLVHRENVVWGDTVYFSLSKVYCGGTFPLL